MGVLDAARGLGMDVPGDVALVSFDEPAYADLIDPPITSLDRHDQQLGRRAAEMLLDALANGGPPFAEPEVERVPLALLVRRSCGCPAR
jgi:LacI family transcriptional regulator